MAHIQKSNVHGYPRYPLASTPTEQIEARNEKMDEYHRKTRRRVNTLWMSESGGYGLEDEAVIAFSFDIIRHLNILKANAWVFWQVLDKVPGWALIMTANRYPWWFSKWNYNPAKTINFYIMKQFSSHIRPGYRILSHSKSSDLKYCHVCVVAAASKTENRVVVVLLNIMAKGVPHVVDVSSVIKSSPRINWTAHRTSHWANENHTDITANVTLGNQGRLFVDLFALSVTTIELFES
jgi:hypothetical protein